MAKSLSKFKLLVISIVRCLISAFFSLCTKPHKHICGRKKLFLKSGERERVGGGDGGGERERQSGERAGVCEKILSVGLISKGFYCMSLFFTHSHIFL